MTVVHNHEGSSSRTVTISHTDGPDLIVTLAAKPCPSTKPGCPGYQAPTTTTPPPSCAVADALITRARTFHQSNASRDGYWDHARWWRVLIAFGAEQPGILNGTDWSAFTAAEALQQERHWNGWAPFRRELQLLEACR